MHADDFPCRPNCTPSERCDLAEVSVITTNIIDTWGSCSLLQRLVFVHNILITVSISKFQFQQTRCSRVLRDTTAPQLWLEQIPDCCRANGRLLLILKLGSKKPSPALYSLIALWYCCYSAQCSLNDIGIKRNLKTKPWMNHLVIGLQGLKGLQGLQELQGLQGK